MFTWLSRYWWVLVLRGAIAILFGVMALAAPRVTLAAMVLMFAAFAFADGTGAIVAAMGGRTLTRNWWVLLLHGLVGIAVGALTLLNPLITAVVLLVYVALWAIAAGALQIMTAIKLREEIAGEWALALGGVVSIGFGVLMLAAPGAGALALLWLIAAFAILWGVLLVAAGFIVHRAGVPA